jgi:hypothetical protein
MGWSVIASPIASHTPSAIAAIHRVVTREVCQAGAENASTALSCASA